jgi:oligopeptide transport system substrate-binding protein
MNKNILFCSLLFIIASCNNSSITIRNSTKAIGNVFYGGVFKVNEIEDFKSLYPLNATDEIALHIDYQLYEGLVRFNQSDLSIIPSLAEKWNISPDGKKYTFTIRKGVRFHNDPCFSGGDGREVTANDFKYCFDLLCSQSAVNQGYGLFKNRVIGATEHHIATAKGSKIVGGVSGIKVIDDYTLEINLIESNASFLNLLAQIFCAVYPKEAFEKYGIDMRVKCVGTGPFFLKEVKEGDYAILSRNNNYWAVDTFGNKLPYLDAIKVSFLKEKKTELLEFKKGNLDMIFRLPLEMISEVVGELEEAQAGGNSAFVMQVMASAQTNYYGFQHQEKVFKDKRVRQAFNYAIDREGIVNHTMQGDGQVAKYGIVPPCFKNYPAKNIKGYTLDINKARQLMAEAGYTGGKNFPEVTLTLNSGGSRNTQVAEVVQKMLQENLGVKVKINVTSFPQFLEESESGKAMFFKAGWVADYPDAENFLNNLYGDNIPIDVNERSYTNKSRYRNATYDSLFLLASNEKNEVKRQNYLALADQIQIDDAAVLMMYYSENTRLIQLNVKNLDQNAMEFRDFTRVYIDPSIKKPATKSDK